jgi:sugar phosphate isomerase/epimerase
MNRRQLLTTLAALPAASQLRAQQPSHANHFKAGLVAYSYRKPLGAKTMKYEEVIRMASDWGLDGLDCTVYWFPDTSAQYLANLRKFAFKNGIQIYNIGVQVNLAQPTPELRNAELEKVKKWVDVADRVGANQMRVFGGPIPKGATEQQAVDMSIETLKQASEISGARGITIGVEDDAGLTIKAAPTIAIVKGANSPWAGINADSGNLRVDGYAQFETLLPLATSVHLKTMVATAEEGKKEPADWNRLLGLISQSGYRGYVGLEYEGNDPEKEVPGYAQKLHKLIREVSM